jgi:hypothetical protein
MTVDEDLLHALPLYPEIFACVTVNSSPSIIKMIKSRGMRWAGHVARMGSRGMHIGYWWESQKEKTTGKTKT